MLVNIIKVLGTIKKEDVDSMSSSTDNLDNFIFPYHQRIEWKNIFIINHNRKLYNTSYNNEYINLINSIIQWKPSDRLNAVEIFNHNFFLSSKDIINKL